MGRGTHRLYTAWVPMGDVPLELGGLMILENSHLQQERLKNYLSRDVDSYCANRPSGDAVASGEKTFPWSGNLAKNPASLREKLGGRWLTATKFRMGDVLIFTVQTVHASLDNQTRAFRFSSDSRYQSATNPLLNPPMNVGSAVILLATRSPEKGGAFVECRFYKSRQALSHRIFQQRCDGILSFNARIQAASANSGIEL